MLTGASTALIGRINRRMLSVRLLLLLTRNSSFSLEMDQPPIATSVWDITSHVLLLPASTPSGTSHVMPWTENNHPDYAKWGKNQSLILRPDADVMFVVGDVYIRVSRLTASDTNCAYPRLFTETITLAFGRNFLQQSHRFCLSQPCRAKPVKPATGDQLNTWFNPLYCHIIL